MLNEATSPLLRAFKDKNHYPRFREKYHKAKKPHTAPPALPIPAGAEGLELGDRAYFIKRLITMGINEYLSIQFKEIASSYSTSGHHGKAGLHRANALSDEIQKCPDDSQKVSKIMFDCFAKNRVGKFTGGIFSKIRTEPTSLFTCICRYLMTPFVIADPGTTAVTAPVPIHWSKLTLSPGLKGPEHSIDRMAYYIHSETITAGESESLYITKKAPQLLTALKG